MKRESGENPERFRHCIRELRIKVLLPLDDGLGRECEAMISSQETCL